MKGEACVKIQLQTSNKYSVYVQTEPKHTHAVIEDNVKVS